jgi:hypothetical protein
MTFNLGPDEFGGLNTEQDLSRLLQRYADRYANSEDEIGDAGSIVREHTAENGEKSRIDLATWTIERD